MIEVCKSRKGAKCFSRVPMPKPTPKEFVYLLQIGEPENGRRLIKIGTTNNITRRMGQLLREYNKPIEILWISPPYAHFTTLRVETKTKEFWQGQPGFEHVPNDRFFIPEGVAGLTVTVKKDFEIEI